jgi:hypothetical protein
MHFPKSTRKENMSIRRLAQDKEFIKEDASRNKELAEGYVVVFSKVQLHKSPKLDK